MKKFLGDKFFHNLMDHFRFLGFCRSSIISLAADFNGGALECQCDENGSTVLDSCESIGGQCSCKANVIGRQCTKCKPGFYGFPDCKQCDCPITATCDENTGNKYFLESDAKNNTIMPFDHLTDYFNNAIVRNLNIPWNIFFEWIIIQIEIPFLKK